MLTGAAVAVDPVLVAPALGTTSTWPSRMKARESRPFALTIAAWLTPSRCAMWLTVSPLRTR